MRFFVIRAKDALVWMISIMVLFYGMGLWMGKKMEEISSVQAFSAELDLTEEYLPSDAFTLEVISVSPPESRKKRVFIYHTHTYEAYEMEGENRYQPTETWRTADSRYNMIRVGEELAMFLRQAGVEVTHDTAAYEPPRLSTAYSRSLEGLKKAAEEGYDLYIDLHRDSYSANNGPNTVKGKEGEMIRFLFLIGQGTGTGFDERPDWKKNQQAADRISDALNAQIENLSRGVSLKSGRYNQQAAVPCILIEAGNNKNTLPQALAAMPCLAQAICRYFDGLE